MIKQYDIQKLLSNHVPPYMYSKDVFKPYETPIFYSGQYWDNRETEAAIDAFVNGKWLVAGEFVEKFEKEFSQKFHHRYSLMVNSGSSANLVMIGALKKYFKWDDDDEILVSPAGFSTTISVIYQNRLKPVFVDIEWDTLNFDLDKLVLKITDRTKAIFLSPVLGNPPNIDYVLSICKIHHLQLIVDNCDSLGSKWDGSYISEYGVAASTSFYPAHHISTAQGGMVSTNHKGIYDIASSLATWGRGCYCSGADNLKGCGVCGKRFSKWLKNYDGVVDHKYVFDNMGYNFNPLDLQGAIGSVQLTKFREIERNRNRSKDRIENIVLSNVRGVMGVIVLPKAEPCWFGTPFICEDTELKHRLVQHFEKYKIQTRNYFAGNILLHPGFDFLGDYKDYPEANQILDRVFFLGAAPHYTSEVFRYIEEIVKKF